MRKIAMVVAVLLASGVARPREARAGCHHCFDPIGYLLLGGIAGGYAYGTGYFIYHDLRDTTQTRSYAAAELGLHGSLALLAGSATMKMVKDGDRANLAMGATLTVMHSALALHGAGTLYQQRGTVRLPSERTIAMTGGIVYGANAMVWLAAMPGDHGRTYGIAEAAVNAPFAAGFAYLAVNAYRDHHTGRVAAFGATSLIAAALTGHGIYTAVNPRESPGLDLLGTDVMPTLVDDGQNTGMGIGASRTW